MLSRYKFISNAEQKYSHKGAHCAQNSAIDNQ